MKISKSTLTILKNFAQINGNMLFEEGQLLMTKSTANNITAEATIPEKFTTEFGIYDMNEFLGIFSLFQDPDLKFVDTHVLISEDKNKVKYFGSDKSILSRPKARMSFKMIQAKENFSFDLSAEHLAQVIKTSALLKLPNLSILGDGTTLSLVVSDEEGKAKNSYSNTYSLDILDSDVKCDIKMRVENLKFVPGPYKVTVSNIEDGDGVTRFIGAGDVSITYHVVIEEESWIE